MNGIVSDINEVLTNHSIDTSIDLSDITITDKTVSDLVKPDSKLSNAIIEYLWPSVSKASVYHFTSKESAEKILTSDIFRLTNIEKRYHEEEIVTFCETHKLQGYLENDESGNPKYRNMIMPNTFYASFADSEINEEEQEVLWNRFAPIDGVRLKIDIEASNPNFRKIRYEQKAGEPIELLTDLVNCIRDNHNREFILKGISRLCSFYLSGDEYGDEFEYRSLYRSWEGFGPQPKGDGVYSYIELPLNCMSEAGFKLTITEVYANDRPNMPEKYTFTKRS